VGNWTKFRNNLIASATTALIERLFGRVVGSGKDDERKKGKDEVTEINPTEIKSTVVIPTPPPPPEPLATFKSISTPEDKTKHLRFGANTGLLIKPAERGGIVVLLPGEYGAAKEVWLEGPRGRVDLVSDGFANLHHGIAREHWRNRDVDPAKLNDRRTKLGRVRKGILGPVKQTFLVVDGHKIRVAKRLDGRVE